MVRRCVDLADLLAAAGGGRAVAALVSADLRRLDREVLARIRAQGVAVVGVADPARRRTPSGCGRSASSTRWRPTPSRRWSSWRSRRRWRGRRPGRGGVGGRPGGPIGRDPGGAAWPEPGAGRWRGTTLPAGSGGGGVGTGRVAGTHHGATTLAAERRGAAARHPAGRRRHLRRQHRPDPRRARRGAGPGRGLPLGDGGEPGPHDAGAALAGGGPAPAGAHRHQPRRPLARDRGHRAGAGLGRAPARSGRGPWSTPASGSSATRSSPYDTLAPRRTPPPWPPSRRRTSCSPWGRPTRWVCSGWSAASASSRSCSPTPGRRSWSPGCGRPRSGPTRAAGWSMRCAATRAWSGC